MLAEDVPTILQEFVQPRVIDQTMLVKLITDHKPKGEPGRLFLEDGIKLDELKEIRIEFLNILKIDNLWVMPNLVKLKLSNNIIEVIENLDSLVHLKELDLSFNHIRIMENLNNLTKLEILLLYNNDIYKVEGIDNLSELTIFSIGNNAIEDWDHVLYLRKLKKLRSLNVSGNPCTKKSGYMNYVFAFIPQLIYYEYKMIRNEERQAAIEEHYRVLSTLEDQEATENKELQAQQEYEEKLAFNTIAYVEHLDGDYLFEHMFDNDTEGHDFRMVNEDTQNAFEEYKKSFSVMCKEFYEVGINEHYKRMEEIKLFNKAVNDGKLATEIQGRKIADEVLEKKVMIIANIQQILKNMTMDEDPAKTEETTQKAQSLAEEFNDMLINAWTQLMSNEVSMHEQIEDINEVFTYNMKDLVEMFLSDARGFFSQLRNREAAYNDTINGLILYLLSGYGDESKMPIHLQKLCGDKDTLNKNLTTSHDLHLHVLDSREDRMITRLKGWLAEYSEQLVKDETERNQQRMLEISHFADTQQEEFNALHLLDQAHLNTSDPEIIQALET